MSTAEPATRPVRTGSAGFDRSLGGGLPPNRLYVLSGPPGSGKTTFSAHAVSRGAADGERCLFVTMHETEHQLLQDLGQFDFGFDRAARSDRVTFVNVVEDDGGALLRGSDVGNAGASVSGLTNRLVGVIESQGFQRVVIDSTMLLEYLLSTAEVNLIPFLVRLKQLDATVLLVSEMTDPTAYETEHYLAHGVLFFHNFLDDDGMRRGLQVLKMRGVPISADIRPLRFTDRGLEIDPDGTVTA